MSANAKKKPDLTTVTVQPAPPVGVEFDTTTPVDNRVVPFTQIYLGSWSAWLLERLGEHWPHFSATSALGLIVGQMNDNSACFIRARRAILLAVATRETLDPRPVIDIVFGFKFEPQDEDQDKDLRLLFRRAEDWGKARGARAVRLLYPERLDFNLTRIKEIFGPDPEAVFMKGLDK